MYIMVHSCFLFAHMILNRLIDKQPPLLSCFFLDIYIYICILSIGQAGTNYWLPMQQSSGFCLKLCLALKVLSIFGSLSFFFFLLQCIFMNYAEQWVMTSSLLQCHQKWITAVLTKIFQIFIFYMSRVRQRWVSSSEWSCCLLITQCCSSA